MANAHQAAGSKVEKISLLRVLGPAHVWALGVGIVLLGIVMFAPRGLAGLFPRRSPQRVT